MSDALERLKQRTRPTVPSRDASLTPPTSDTSTSRNLDIQASEKPEPQELSSSAPELQTKQSTLRLEQGMSDRLQDLCRTHNLCREVVIEALFEYCEANPEALQAVLSEAKTKNDHRQQIANLRRAKSMMQRFGQSG